MATPVAGNQEVAADDLPLVELFGDTARTRLLSIFATKRSREFSITELAEETGLTRTSVYDHIDELVALSAVERVEAGKRTRYRTADSELARKCYELSGVALERLLDVEGKLD